MASNPSNPIQQIVNQRFNKLFVDVKAAQSSAASDGVKPPDAVEIEQSKTARSLLRIERQAIREKDLNKKLERNNINEIRDQVDAEVEKRLVERLEDTDDLYNKIIGIDETLPELLDLMTVRASTISKIEPHAGNIPWLYQDLMKLANQPAYRRFDGNGKVIPVETLRVALSFFGIENLIPVVLSLAIKRWLPQITDPYPQIKNRIWEQAMATGMSCKRIASVSGVDEAQAFCLGMLNMVGTIVTVRLYFRLFEGVQREALIEAQEAQKHQEHLDLLKIQPSGEFLTYLMEKFAMSVSSKLIDKMNMRRVFIANAMEEVASAVPLKDMTPMGKVLFQSHAYAKYRMLRAHKLLDIEQSKDFLRTLGLPPGALNILKTTDMRSLNLNMDNK
jgi:HD-like signal output (HDOD) protein